MEELIIPTPQNGYSSILKPVVAWATFCADPVTFNHCGEQTCDDNGNNCLTDKLGTSDSIWVASQKQLVAVLGNGNATSLAPELQDANTYVKLWAKAFVKYLRAASQSPTDLSLPTFDAFTPSDSDITLTPGANGVVSMKYLSKLEVLLSPTTGNISAITFR